MEKNNLGRENPEFFLPVKNVDEICRAKNFAMESGENFFTNFFAGDKELKKFISKNNLKYHLADKTLFVMREFENFSKLGFVTSDVKDFCDNAKIFLPETKLPVSVEIFADPRNRDEADAFQKNLLELGFKHRATQTRLTKISEQNFYGEIDPNFYATTEDCEEILQMLLETFDVCCDQIPDIDELREFAENREILKLRKDDKIVSAIIFWRKPASAEWVFWLTRPEYRPQFCGLKLRDEYIKLTRNVRRQILHVREKKMKHLHEGFGFKADGFENRVFVFEK